MTASTIETTSMAGNMAASDMSIISLIAQSDIIVKAVIILLLLASLWSWTIIFDKLKNFRKIRAQTKKFETAFWSGRLLDDLYERVVNHTKHPMAAVFIAAMQEWRRRGASDSDASTHLRAGIKERIFQAMQVARNRGVDNLEKNIAFLATVGSSAPFLGLFGTVWGIMNSFQSIAASKNTTLAVVAPGIAEALLATAIGLFAAIPAMIFYNKFSSDLNRMVGQIDDFSNELDALLSREMDGANASDNSGLNTNTGT